MLYTKKKEFRKEDYEVRASLRLLGAFISVFLAYLFADSALDAFHATSVAIAPCPTRRGFNSCEIGNWLTTVIPVSLQGPIAGAAYIGMSLIFLLVMWWLLKPCIIKLFQN